jgi:hypothetical protein
MTRGVWLSTVRLVMCCVWWGWRSRWRLSGSGRLKVGAVRQSLGVVLACALLLALVTSSSTYASTGFGIERYSLSATNEDGSMDTQAGSHPYELTAEADLDANMQVGSEVKNLTFELPPGLIIDGAAVTHCGYPEFSERHCPPNTAIGVLTAKLGGSTESAAVYNLPGGVEAASQLGFSLSDLVVVAEVAADPGDGYGMRVSIRDFPNAGLESVKLTLDGAPRSAFLTLPTSCGGSQSTTLQGESWGAETASVSISFPQMAGCELLSFEPVIDVVQELLEAGAPSGYWLEATIPQDEQPLGLATAQIQQVLVTFPAGVSLAPSGMEGVVGCSEAEFGLTSTGLPTCPSASQIGTFKLHTPLLDGLGEALRGLIYAAEAGTNAPGGPIALYLGVEPEGAGEGGLLVKFAGQLTQNSATGRLTLSLNDVPQLLLSNIELRFFGGRRALLANPPTCGTFTVNSELAPWSEGPHVMSSSSFQITEGITGGPCPITPSSPPPSSAATTSGPGPTSTTPVAATTNAGSVTLDGSTITVHGGGLALVKLACTGGGTCDGKLSLTDKVPLGKGKRLKAKPETIGTAGFSIPPGKTATIDLALNKAGRTSLGAAHGHISATLTILRSSQAPSQTLTENVGLVRPKVHGLTRANSCESCPGSVGFGYL